MYINNNGFDIEILGMHRVNSASKRCRSAFRRNGTTSLQDTRKFNTGSPTENELLKKLEMLERSVDLEK